jgi:hypothetical protein
MLHRCKSIYFGFTGRQGKKKAGTKNGPGIELAGCPDKSYVGTAALGCPAGEARPCRVYAVRLGRTVKSRN